MKWELRLLPVTIAVLALLLAVKSTVLVRGLWVAGEMVGASVLPRAQAASHEPEKKPASHEKVAEKKPADARGDGVAPAEAKVAPQEPPVSDSERAILLDLRQRRRELDSREAALAGREAILSGTDRKLTARVEELQTLQKKLEVLDAARLQREDVGWQGLVKTYQSMKPREAAAIQGLRMKFLSPAAP